MWVRSPPRVNLSEVSPQGHFTVLAQLVERVAFNHNVAGSIPAGGIFFACSTSKKNVYPLRLRQITALRKENRIYAAQLKSHMDQDNFQEEKSSIYCRFKSSRTSRVTDEQDGN